LSFYLFIRTGIIALFKNLDIVNFIPTDKLKAV
jgi:hypothetical protein